MSALALMLAMISAEPNTVSTAPAGQAVEELRCRRYDEIGSLVRKRKVCRTDAQWRKVDEAARKTGREMQERGMGGPPPSG